jgi:type II secretory pathway component GspD/PulD (secretin)
MKLKFNAILVLAALCGAAFAADAVKDEPKPAAPAEKAKASKPAALVVASETDEIDLDKLDDSADAARKAPTVTMASPGQTNALAQASTSTNTSEQVAIPIMSTGLVDIDCDDATLADILRQFRKTTGANIISSDSSNLQQRVSVSLKHVPWLDALQAILNTKKFRLEPRGDIYFVSEDKQIEPVFTKTFALNHASSKELAELFNTTLGTSGAKDPKTGKPQVRQIATAFEGANVVVVTASEKILSDCEQIIRSVDKSIPQIYIEARFIEVSNEAMHKLGMQWNQLESWGATVKNLEGGWSYNNGRVGSYGTRVASSQSTAASSVDGEGKTTGNSSQNQTIEAITPTGVGNGNSGSSFNRSAEDMAWRNARGFSGQLSVDDFRLALSAFEQMDDVKVFSNPKIIVSNGKEALVDMTTKFPNVRVQATRNTSNGSDSLDISTQLEVIPGEDKLMFAKEVFFSWGITLSVKPRISPDGLINVEIVPTISQLDTDVSSTGFYQVSGGDSSAYSSYPVIQVKRLTTDFTMKDGATAVIGGLSKTTEEDIDSGIPYLRKIPWIGPKIFGWKSRGKVQKEIIVCVTLGMADPADLPADVGLPKNAIVGREYVTGRKFEPGDRVGGLADVMSLDMRPIEEKQSDNSRGSGTVTITPVVESGK